MVRVSCVLLSWVAALAFLARCGSAAVPLEPVRTKPTKGILLGTGTRLDDGQIDRGGAELTLMSAGGRQSLKMTYPNSETAVRLKPAVGRWNLSDYTQVTLVAHNSGSVPVTLSALIESAAGDSDWVSAPPAAPGAAVEIVIPFAGKSVWKGDRDSGSQMASDAVNAVAIQATGTGAGRQVLVDSISAELSPPAQVPDWLGKHPPVNGKWAQTLDENFDGTIIDPTRWSVHGENYYDKQSHFSAANVIVGGGVAKLHFEKKRGHANDDPRQAETDYATGFLTSFGKWTQRYGYFEARMKLPTAAGLWPAFWMMPDRGPEAGNREATEDGGMEFDIMEALTRFGPNRYNIAMHWDGYGKDHKTIGNEHIYIRADKDGFITSGMLWEKGHLAFYCNGTLVAGWANPRVSNVPAHFLFTLPCGGWDGNDLDGTGLPDDFVIDWVRAWQRQE